MAIQVGGIHPRERIQSIDRAQCLVALHNRTRTLIVKHARIHFTPQSTGVSVTPSIIRIRNHIGPGEHQPVNFNIITKGALPGYNYLLFDITYYFSRIGRRGPRRKLYRGRTQQRKAFRVYLI